MLTNKQVLLMGLQASAGAGAVLTATDYLGAYDISVSAYEGDQKGSNLLKPHLGSNKTQNINPHSKLSFKVDMPFLALAGVNTPPLIANLLKASAMLEDIDATVGAQNIAYNLMSNPNDGLFATFEYFQDSQVNRIENARGTWSIELSAQGFWTFSFEFLGDVSLPATATLPVIDATSWEIVHPLTKTNTPVVNLFGQACELKSFSLNPNQSQSYQNNPGGTSGHKYGGSRDFSCSMSITAPTLATFDWFAKLQSQNGIISTGSALIQHGTQSGNNLSISVLKSQISSVTVADSDGEIDYNIDLNVLQTLGNDDASLIFNKFIA